MRQVSILGGLSSCLGIVAFYHRHFGWHLGFDFQLFMRALGVMVFWGACWYLMSVGCGRKRPESSPIDASSTALEDGWRTILDYTYLWSRKTGAIIVFLTEWHGNF